MAPGSELFDDLRRPFGTGATLTPLTTAVRMGRRVEGIALSWPLSPDQARLLIAMLDH